MDSMGIAFATARMSSAFLKVKMPENEIRKPSSIERRKPKTTKCSWYKHFKNDRRREEEFRRYRKTFRIDG